MIDVIIVALIAVIMCYLLVRMILNDREKERLAEKRFVVSRKEGTLEKSYRIRVAYGVPLSVIRGCAIYVYFRLSGKLENIFPDCIDYFGL